MEGGRSQVNRRVRVMVTVLAILSQAVLVSWVLAGNGDPGGGFSARTTLPERVLHFPADRSIGEVALIDEAYVVPEMAREFHPGYVFAPSRYLGPARGEVRVPAGQCVCLHLGGRGVTRQQCFECLVARAERYTGSDFLQPLQVDDAFLPYVARLTGITHFCPVGASPARAGRRCNHCRAGDIARPG